MLAGLAGGFFGGGGGMILLPLLSRQQNLAGKRAFATCLASILPMCCVSAAVYWWQVQPPWTLVLPYLLGGAVGGALGGLTFRKVPVGFLRVVFGLFLLYGGVRYLL